MWPLFNGSCDQVMWWPHGRPSWAWPWAPYTGPPACSSGRPRPSSSPPSGTVPPSDPSSPCIGPPPGCSSSHNPHTAMIQQKHINKDKAKPVCVYYYGFENSENVNTKNWIDFLNKLLSTSFTHNLDYILNDLHEHWFSLAVHLASFEWVWVFLSSWSFLPLGA